MSFAPCRFSNPAAVDLLQVHGETEIRGRLDPASSFQVDWIRFESALVQGREVLHADLILADSQGTLAIPAIAIDGDTPCFPAPWKGLAPATLARLSDVIREQIARGPLQQQEIRRLSCSPALDPGQVHEGGAFPGFWDYASLALRMTPFRSAASHALADGRCACFSLDPFASPLAATLFPRRHLEVFAPGSPSMPQAASPSERFATVLSMDMLCAVPDPHAHLEEMVHRLDPEGVLLLSVPTEDRRRPLLDHKPRSLWNAPRLERLLDQHFSDVELIGTRSFLEEDGPCSGLLAILRRPRKRPRHRIVLNRDYAIGDVLWTLPIARQLKAENPLSELIVTTRCIDVFRGCPDVDQVLLSGTRPELGDRIIDLDLVYESRRALHPLDAYAQIAEVVPEHPDPVFHPLKRDREAMAKRMKSGLPENLQHIVALHTAASSPDRIWPKEHWKAFIHSMLEEGRTGIVLLGAGKDYDGKDLDLPPHPLVLDLVRTLDLSETGACLSFCDLVIGPDSGLSHLGPAVGTPVLALHNMAIPETRLPFRIPGKALWVDAPCRGCLSHIPPNHPVACIHKNVDCMRSILPEQVHHTAREMLGSIPAHAWQRRVHAGSRKADPASAPVPPRPPARFVDNPVFTPLRILCQMIRNHRNHAMWASRKDLKIG